MKTLFARTLVLLACIHLLGGHWFAMQGVAWVTMLVDHSREDSLVVAIGKTFDGQHPCTLCKVVDDGQDEERRQKEALTELSAKLLAVLPTEVPMEKMAPSDLSYFSRTTSPQSVDLVPISPPPRTA
ncbi:MAG: hypothetical protein KA250_12225 [Verrucomicrobiales bacterium]|nr:hypothetical protein [Verrucomicrobiales bacterium]MBP9222261.1 hypothetical protein [Verrucomicrobiales bacterium]HQZ27347.1 hypothetical protein [Verrucomicrobiales bacterium]